MAQTEADEQKRELEQMRNGNSPSDDDDCNADRLHRNRQVVVVIEDAGNSVVRP